MKAVKLTIILLAAIAALSFICSEEPLNPAIILPFCDGERVNAYHWGGLAALVITVWGYYRLNNDSEDE